MHRWNKEYLEEIEEKNKRFREFDCFIFNKANELSVELSLNWIILEFYKEGFRKLELKQNYECWSSFSRKYKEYEKQKIKFQDDFLRLEKCYIQAFKDLLLEELNCDSDYKSEYENEKEQIIDYCFNKVMTDLERWYESYVGQKSNVCIERIKKRRVI